VVAVARRAAPTKPKLTAVPRARARRLLTVDAGDRVPGDLIDSLVRVCPGRCDEDRTRQVVAEIAAAGAAAVKVMPPDREEPALPKAARATRVYQGPREAVLRLAGEVRGVDRSALMALCEEIMGEEGL
jgi:hypothetical protein